MKKFAIKIGKTGNDRILSENIQRLTKFYPSLKIEGLTDAIRPRELEIVSQTLISDGVQSAVVTEATTTSDEDTVLAVGVSKEFDISFEDINRLPKYFGIVPAIKVYDVRTDLKTIIRLISEYLIETFPVETLFNVATRFTTPIYSVNEYSTTIAVNGMIFNKREIAINRPSVDSILRILF